MKNERVKKPNKNANTNIICIITHIEKILRMHLTLTELKFDQMALFFTTTTHNQCIFIHKIQSTVCFMLVLKLIPKENMQIKQQNKYQNVE